MNSAGLSMGDVIRAAQIRRPTVLILAPALLHLFLEALLHLFLEAAESVASDHEIRLVVTGGGALSPRDVRAFFRRFPDGVELWKNYGSTEAGPIRAARYGPEHGDAVGVLPLTEPAHHCEVEVVDDEGSPEATGVTGNILVRSSYLAAEYVGGPAAEESRFSTRPEGRTLHTGDRGRLGPAGDLYVPGCEDRQLNLRGRRFEAGEIEAVLKGDARVLDAAVEVMGDETSAARFVAVLQVPAGLAPDLDTVRDRGRRRRRNSASVTPSLRCGRSLLLGSHGSFLPDDSPSRISKETVPTHVTMCETWRESIGAPLFEILWP